MILPVFVIGILMLGILAATGNAQESSNTGTTSGAASGADQQSILTIHNRERAAVGVAPLTWSDSLAANANTWLDKLLAENGGAVEGGNPLRHDDVNTGKTCTLGTACQGENLARISDARRLAPPVAASVEELVGRWVGEPKGPLALNHYTQMVWKDTKEVGCATATVRGMTSDGWHGANVYLVCRYSPPGNYEGVPAYRPP